MKVVSLRLHPQIDLVTDMATKKIGASLQAINAQIAALQAKADAIRKQEVGEVVAKIKDAIAHYGLTAADLGLSGSAPKAANAPKASKPGRKPGRKATGVKTAGKPARAAKYTDGQGRTWGGMGKRPDWFKAALAAGKTPEDLLIKA
jgi:DNA-binding protein H-NS